MIKKRLSKLLHSGWSLLLIGSILTGSTSQVFAVSPAQRKALQAGGLYVNTESSVCTTSGSTAVATPSTPATALTSGSKIYILGDSITAISESTYVSSFQAKGITASVDGSGDRGLITNKGVKAGRLTTGMEAIAADTDQISTANAIVVALGTNEGLTPEGVDSAVTALRQANTSAPIYWVDISSTGTTVTDKNRRLSVDRIKSVNTIINNLVGTKLAGVISWFSIVSPGADPLNPTGTELDPNGYVSHAVGDSVHPTAPGVTALTDLVINTVMTGAPSPPSAVPSVGTAPYDPTIISFPAFPDETAVAAGIENTIRQRSPNSGWLQIQNLGKRLIDEGRTYNINPLLIVAAGAVESNFGTSPVGISHKNSFGMTSSGTGYITFSSYEESMFGDKGFPKIIANNVYHNGASGAYSKVQDIYEYFSVHETGEIHYPGDGMHLEDHHTTPPTIVSWETQYNPLQYYKINIGIINQITGLSLPSDQPPHASGAIVAQTTTSTGTGCSASGAAPLISGTGGYDLPGGGANPMVYYSQLKSGTNPAVQGYFGNEMYGTAGNIETCGCGPTSMAMVVSTLTSNKKTPKEVADFAVSKGYQLADCGSSLFWTKEDTQTEYGINVKELSTTDDIAQSLIQGNRLVLLYVSSFPLPGLTAGHYTVVRKYVNGQFYFADPFSDGWGAQKDVSNRAYSKDEIIGMMSQAWEITAK